MITPAINQFAQLWKAGPPDLDAFLSTTPLEPVECAEVLRFDQGARWQAGERIPAEWYVQRLPGEPPADDLVLDLIYNEFLLREEMGEQPTLSEYRSRFPTHATVLSDQIALHNAVGGTGPWQSSGRSTPRPSVTAIADALDQPHRPGTAPKSFGRYQILSVIGRGGMGVVYLAHDSALGRQVALKVPRFDTVADPAVTERFRREARAAAALDHPGLCPVYDIGQIDGVDYLSMKYVSGGSLEERLRREGPQSPNEAARIVRQVGLALADAHKSCIIHRDLKPSNILINERGDPVVTDFGLSRRIDGNGKEGLTMPGAMLGTAAYMPPEQIGSKPELMGPRCDIHSLGVILFELLTGRVPYQGSVAEIIEKVLSVQPPPPSTFRQGIPPALDAVCMKAMAKEPKERFSTMEEFVQALDRATAPARRRRLMFALAPAGVLILVLISVGLWFAGHRSTEQLETAEEPEKPAAPGTIQPDTPDPFSVGQEWAGEFQFQGAAMKGDVLLRITERSGNQFRGTYSTEHGEYQWEVSGTIEQRVIRWKLDKPLTAAARTASIPGQATINGRYEGQSIVGDFLDLTDNSRAEIRLSLRK